MQFVLIFDEETEETFQIKRSSRWQSFFPKGVLKRKTPVLIKL